MVLGFKASIPQIFPTTGFKKIAKGEFAGSYFHPHFKKGNQAAATRIRRCVRKEADKEADTEPIVKTEPITNATKATRKPPANIEPTATRKPPANKPAASPVQSLPGQPKKAFPIKIKRESPMTRHVNSPAAFHMNDKSRQPKDSCNGLDFWDENLCEDEVGIEHELALPLSLDGEDIDMIPNCYAGTSACCSTPCRNLMDIPLEDEDDLAEWEKVLCFTSKYCPELGTRTPPEENLPPPQPQPRQAQNNGANAFCVQVPAGPLGATLECQGDKVFLSKVNDCYSPLAHIPLGAQLVNLDGKDTTQMPVDQISKLDESTCHRDRMVIFMLNQCFNTALLAMTPTVPEPHRRCDWGLPKAKSTPENAMDMDMDMDACSDCSDSSDSSSRPESFSYNYNNSWLNCLYEVW